LTFREVEKEAAANVKYAEKVFEENATFTFSASLLPSSRHLNLPFHLACCIPDLKAARNSKSPSSSAADAKPLSLSHCASEEKQLRGRRNPTYPFLGDDEVRRGNPFLLLLLRREPQLGDAQDARGGGRGRGADARFVGGGLVNFRGSPILRACNIRLEGKGKERSGYRSDKSITYFSLMKATMERGGKRESLSILPSYGKSKLSFPNVAGCPRFDSLQRSNGSKDEFSWMNFK